MTTILRMMITGIGITRTCGQLRYAKAPSLNRNTAIASNKSTKSRQSFVNALSEHYLYRHLYSTNSTPAAKEARDSHHKYSALFLRLCPLRLNCAHFSMSPSSKDMVAIPYCHWVRYATPAHRTEKVNPSANKKALQMKLNWTKAAWVNTPTAAPAFPQETIFMAVSAVSSVPRTMVAFILYPLLVLSRYASISERLQRFLFPMIIGFGKASIFFCNEYKVTLEIFRYLHTSFEIINSSSATSILFLFLQLSEHILCYVNLQIERIKIIKKGIDKLS
jgi:hypothetical protein